MCKLYCNRLKNLLIHIGKWKIVVCRARICTEKCLNLKNLFTYNNCRFATLLDRIKIISILSKVTLQKKKKKPRTF